MGISFKVKILSVALFCICTGNVLSQANKITFFGRLVSSQDSDPVSFATIYNKTGKQVTYSDSIGFFKMLINKGDTLFISRIGFEPKEIVLDDQFLNSKQFTIRMDVKVFALKPVTMPKFGTYSEFKKEIINMKLPKPENEINPYAFYSKDDVPVILQEQASIPLFSPVTAMYNLLSKEGKARRRMEKFKEQEQNIRSYGERYNAGIVSKLTGLTDQELEKFMKYCDPDINFVMNSTDKEIEAKILECFKAYSAGKNPSNQSTPTP